MNICKSCKPKSYQEVVQDFIKSGVEHVSNDPNRKKAFIVISVESNEKGDGAHVDVMAAGTKENLLYALTQFATRQESKGLFLEAVKFINFINLTKIFGK